MDVRILLIGLSRPLSDTIRALLALERSDVFRVNDVSDVGTAAALIATELYTAAFYELSAESSSDETLQRLVSAAPQLPVIVLSHSRPDASSTRLLEQGAQDYLLVDRLDSYSLVRAVVSAIGRKAAEDAFFAAKELAEVTLYSIGDAVLSTDVSGTVMYVNKAAELMTGWSATEAVGAHFTTVLHILNARTRELAGDPVKRALQERQTVNMPAQCVLVRRDGTEISIVDSAAPMHDRLGKVTGAVIVFHDVSESRAMTERMAHLAQHDVLTNLPNRALLSDRLAQALVLAERHKRRVAILFVDIDNFKGVNDSLGHAIGDELLKEVAHRLSLSVRGSDTVSRRGGDEFVILLSEIEDASASKLTAEKIRLAIAAPYAIDRHMLHLTASIGISLYPEDGHDLDSLIKSADIAMYHAKGVGRNNSQCFDERFTPAIGGATSLADDMAGALSQGEFVLHYQPIMDLPSGTLIGAEALIRWKHRTLGLLHPDSFVALAEATGWIKSIGEWVLREACRQARVWADSELGFRQISVNISAIELMSKDFVNRVSSILNDTGLAPERLEIEITETAVLGEMRAAGDVLRALSATGVCIAMDDFGTGYSSLSHLMQFPIDTLKIDKSFVQNAVINAEAATIVGAVISLGQSLSMRIVAEGIETVEQLNFLKQRGCTVGQGYYFSKPGPAKYVSSVNGKDRKQAAKRRTAASTHDRSV